ncbi:hypothetical protein SAMN04487926_101587 [Paraburkholderia steynii]|uniref:Uncharacterized protein n=1 Tax=Paraburkholderia steynii TaxID=1245441 RepID=A0A7Z7B0L5_9BURK|nr:hypothetical protein SAMN04487926_101587 [Paraburkholderia steynii]
MAGELPDMGAVSNKWTRSRRAHANTASNNGPTRRGSWQPTSISLRPRAPARQLGARPDTFEGCGLAAAGRLAHCACLSRSGCLASF